MTLIPCPGCGRIVSDAAPSCPQCGRATRVTGAPPPRATAPEGAVTVDRDSSPPIAAPQVPPAVALPVPRDEHTLFPVATSKFVTMSLFTLSLYPIYWMFRNWQRIRLEGRESLSPFWRAFFTPFWSFALFERVRIAAERRKLSVGWSEGLLGVLYFILSITWRLPDPWWIISLGAFLPLIPVVRTIEQMHAAEPAVEGLNSRYTAPNIVAMIIGGIVLILALLGTFFMPAEGG